MGAGFWADEDSPWRLMVPETVTGRRRYRGEIGTVYQSPETGLSAGWLEARRDSKSERRQAMTLRFLRERIGDEKT